MPSGYIEYELDEEYPFLLRQPKQGNPFGEVIGHLSIAVHGIATIAYDDVDDWALNTLDVNADNGMMGDKAKGWTERVDGPLFKAVADYLNTKQADRIADMIRADIEGQRETYLADRAKAIREDAALGW